MRRYYGFVPDGIRGALVFACMAGNSALLLLSRSLSFALLALIDPNYPLFYTLADVGLFFLQKIARNDLHVWLNVYRRTDSYQQLFIQVAELLQGDFFHWYLP